MRSYSAGGSSIVSRHASVAHSQWNGRSCSTPCCLAPSSIRSLIDRKTSSLWAAASAKSTKALFPDPSRMQNGHLADLTHTRPPRDGAAPRMPASATSSWLQKLPQPLSVTATSKSRLESGTILSSALPTALKEVRRMDSARRGWSKPNEQQPTCAALSHPGRRRFKSGELHQRKVLLNAPRQAPDHHAGCLEHADRPRVSSGFGTHEVPWPPR
jgi:hypothetical protein